MFQNEKPAKARVVKQQKPDKPEPVLPEKVTKTDPENRQLYLIVNQLNYGCTVSTFVD